MGIRSIVTWLEPRKRAEEEQWGGGAYRRKIRGVGTTGGGERSLTVWGDLRLKTKS
jgi:hypothetical protein